jgi:hypothetical protein
MDVSDGWAWIIWDLYPRGGGDSGWYVVWSLDLVDRESNVQ